MGDRGVVETECLMTAFAIKVYVHVVIVVVIAPMAHTELVFYVRYTTLIDCEDSLFQFGH